MHRSLHDPLTGLPNRILFRDRLVHALERGHRENTPTCVLVVDLDGFKAINDALGHAVGDAVLVAFADRLRAVLRASDTAARLGGDEFSIVCENTDRSDAEVLADRLRRSMQEPLVLEGTTVPLGMSIGIGSRRAAATPRRCSSSWSGRPTTRCTPTSAPAAADGRRSADREPRVDPPRDVAPAGEAGGHHRQHQRRPGPGRRTSVAGAPQHRYEEDERGSAVSPPVTNPRTAAVVRACRSVWVPRAVPRSRHGVVPPGGASAAAQLAERGGDHLAGLVLHLGEVLGPRKDSA